MGISANRFRELFTEAMEKRGARAEFSKKTGISRPVIQGYIDGKNAPGVDQLDRIADALGVQAFQLIKPADESTADTILRHLKSDDQKEMEALFFGLPTEHREVILNMARILSGHDSGSHSEEESG